MNSRFDVKVCLSVFNHIVSHGKKNDENYVFQGFTAWSDFDGYTCFLSYNNVTLTMMFHGKYEVDYKNKDELLLFENKINQFFLKQ